MNRFTIGGLMAFIVVYAVGLTALRNANDVWAGIMLMIAFAAVGVAVLGAICLRGKPRFWWIGFAVFESGYLMLAFGPWCETEIQPKLATTVLLRYVHDQAVGYAPSVPYKGVTFMVNGKKSGSNPLVYYKKSAAPMTLSANPSAPPPPVNRWRSLLPGALKYNFFLLVGHSLFALLAGLIGGAIARWFHSIRG